jgi:hypothetical protein
MRSKLAAVLSLFVALASAPGAPAPAAEDDGFALSIQATGDFTGNLEPCG